MNRLARHEAAQRASMAEKRSHGWVVVSCSTTEIVDYICIDPEDKETPLAVEIKTGTSRLKPRQKAWCEDPPCQTVVEYWKVNGTAAPEFVWREYYAPKTT